MSVLRRLFGGDTGGDDGPDDGDPGPGAYLEFVGGSAAKFYAVVIEPAADGTFSVAFNFGRIGFPREWARKVEGVDDAAARRVVDELVAEKARKGYERRPWPTSLTLPGGGSVASLAGAPDPTVRGIHVSTVRGSLPPAEGGIVAGIGLPAGMLIAPAPEGGPRGEGDVLWVSTSPVPNVTDVWKRLMRLHATTGLWPLVVSPGYGIDRMPEIVMDIPRSTGADPFTLMRRWWHEATGALDDEFDEETCLPFGRAFPGLALRSPGERPASIEPFVAGLEGHLGLVAVERPARTLDAIGWMGPANYDINPVEQSAILDTWEDRFDAYLVGLSFDTITLAVARPPSDLDQAYRIAAEHLAFCNDNIYQGVGSIREYAPLLVRAHRWDFWWD